MMTIVRGGSRDHDDDTKWEDNEMIKRIKRRRR